MPRKRVTTQEKKLKGTFNVTKDADKDFTIIDGLVQLAPKHPEDYSEDMVNVWQKAWRHMIKHNYGKEADYELTDIMVREWANYHKFCKLEMTLPLAHKCYAVYIKSLECLGINPAAMAKVAPLVNKQKPSTLADLLKKKQA